jgi:hypothetical protein
MTNPQDIQLLKSARTIGVVLFLTVVLWMGLQLVGRDMGWPIRFALLIDLAALAGFVWCLVATYRIWRQR